MNGIFPVLRKPNTQSPSPFKKIGTGTFQRTVLVEQTAQIDLQNTIIELQTKGVRKLVVSKPGKISNRREQTVVEVAVMQSGPFFKTQLTLSAGEMYGAQRLNFSSCSNVNCAESGCAEIK